MFQAGQARSQQNWTLHSWCCRKLRQCQTQDRQVHSHWASVWWGLQAWYSRMWCKNCAWCSTGGVWGWIPWGSNESFWCWFSYIPRWLASQALEGTKWEYPWLPGPLPRKPSNKNIFLVPWPWHLEKVHPPSDVVVMGQPPWHKFLEDLWACHLQTHRILYNKALVGAARDWHQKEIWIKALGGCFRPYIVLCEFNFHLHMSFLIKSKISRQS